MDRKTFMAAGAAGAAGLVVPAVAEARNRMGPKFNTNLRIRRDGLVVVAKGPNMGNHVSGPRYYAVVIQQGHRLGHGMSELYHATDEDWDADVVADFDRFRPGSAVASGIALASAGEAYLHTWAWSMHVQLHH